MILTNENWNAYASSLCAGASKPEDYDPASMKIFMEEFGEYISVVKNVRPQFKAFNSIKQIPFGNKQEREDYKNAIEHFQREKTKLQKKEDETGRSQGMGILAQLIIFQIAAERIKAPAMARLCYESVQAGKAAVCAFKYKVAISRCVKILVEEYGVSRSQISLIWGGGNTKIDKKKKEKLDTLDKINSSPEMLVLLKQAGVDMYDLGLGTTEKPIEVVSEEEADKYELGFQTREKRQEEIDRFQSGQSLYCFFTFQSGGVGLSLHQSDEMTTDWDRSKPGFKEWFESIPEKERPAKGKVRRKESGYAYEEDIPFIPIRQREFYGAVTYNPVHAVQVFGRCQRLTSLSDTYQYLVGYKGTIEIDILIKCSLKLKCLQQVVQQKEDWEGLIIDQIARWNPMAAPEFKDNLIGDGTFKAPENSIIEIESSEELISNNEEEGEEE